MADEIEKHTTIVIVPMYEPERVYIRTGDSFFDAGCEMVGEDAYDVKNDEVTRQTDSHIRQWKQVSEAEWEAHIDKYRPNIYTGGVNSDVYFVYDTNRPSGTGSNIIARAGECGYGIVIEASDE